MYRFTVLAALTILFSLHAEAQVTHTYRGKSTYHTRVNFSDIDAYSKAHPADSVPKKKAAREHQPMPEYGIEGKKILYLDHSRIMGYVGEPKGDPSPLPDADFLGLGDNNSSIPPDVNGSVGPNHLMITLNTEIRIMDKLGSPVSTVTTGSFWFPMPGAGDVFDPKIQYDPYENRWMLVMASSSDVQKSALFVAVSATDDPTGDWYLYSFDSDPDNGHWFDYPSYGFNRNWIVVSGNMFGSNFGYNVLFAISKADLYNGLPAAGYSRFEIENAFTIVPALTYDANLGDMYMVSVNSGNQNGYGYLNLWKVAGTVGAEQVEDLGLVGVPDPWESWSGAPGGNLSPQLGTDEKINSGDGRIQNVVFRNGKIWCTHHIFLPVGDQSRSAIQWWEMDTDGTVFQRGRVDDPSGFFHYTFPTIAVNAFEDIMIGYSSFSPEQYAGCSYSFRYSYDPPDMLRDRYQYFDGLAPYFKNFGTDRNRWGDYSATTIDPVDDLDFWTLQEYADLPAGGYDRWGTWWAMVKIDAAPEALFTSNITTVPVGSGVHFTDLSKFEPTSWKWIFEGANPGTSQAQNPQNIIYPAEGTFDVTLIAINDLGVDTVIMQDFINANYTILPEVHFTVGDTIPCTGETVLFEDQTVYNPVSWDWSFEPANVSFANATSAQSQHPEVIFLEPVTYTVELVATNLNGSNTLTRENLILAGGFPIPFSEDFESKSFMNRAWLIDNPDEDKTWEITETGGNEPGSYSAWINIRYYSQLGARDRLISAPVNLSGCNTAILEFDHAYAQRFTQYTDSLIVLVSADCGQTWTRLAAFGEEGNGSLATAPAGSDPFFPSLPEHWCGEEGSTSCKIIDLSAYAGSSNLQIAFESYNGYGNNLFLDNITIRSIDPVHPVKPEHAYFHIWPNPAGSLIHIRSTESHSRLDMEIFDLTGKKVMTDVLIDVHPAAVRSIQTDGLANGAYMIILGNTGTWFGTKLFINR
ncbi:MAG: choice-of-anchor J domain-containing protein [Bacteroidales bacterium]|nr:choice-of-anchor J domain-containing protein [Bacteroidales bacterium]